MRTKVAELEHQNREMRKRVENTEKELRETRQGLHEKDKQKTAECNEIAERMMKEFMSLGKLKDFVAVEDN